MDKIRITEQKLRTIVKNAVHEAYDKRSIIRKLYRIVEPFTHSKYHDSAWNGVDGMIEALENAGYDVSVSVENGGYRNSKGGNTLFAGTDVSYWKEFNLEIPIDDKMLHGRIKAHLCGTIEDPYSSYDLTCTFW